MCTCMDVIIVKVITIVCIIEASLSEPHITVQALLVMDG